MAEIIHKFIFMMALASPGWILLLGIVIDEKMTREFKTLAKKLREKQGWQEQEINQITEKLEGVGKKLEEVETDANCD